MGLLLRAQRLPHVLLHSCLLVRPTPATAAARTAARLPLLRPMLLRP